MSDYPSRFAAQARAFAAELRSGADVDPEGMLWIDAVEYGQLPPRRAHDVRAALASARGALVAAQEATPAERVRHIIRTRDALERAAQHATC